MDDEQDSIQPKQPTDSEIHVSPKNVEQPKKEEHPTQDNEPKADGPFQQWKSKWANLDFDRQMELLIATIVGVIAVLSFLISLGLWLDSRGQGEISKGALDTAKKSADAATKAAEAASAQVDAWKRIQRASVTFDGITVARKFLSNGKVVGILLAPTWRNTGGSLARNGFTRVNRMIRADPLPNGFDYPDIFGKEEPSPSQIVIGAFGTTSVNLELSIDTLIDFKEKRSRIFLLGLVYLPRHFRR